MRLAPIVLFVYNRPDHTLQTLESLMNNDWADQSELFIYCDGPKEGSTNEQLEKINAVRSVVRKKKWCQTIHIYESDKNNTHPVNLVNRVTEIVNRFGKIIVLEDDLVLGKGFLKYMNEGLEIYEHDADVMNITGYLPAVKKDLPETFFLKYFICWGWATWKRAWDNFNHDANQLLNEIPESSIRRFNLDGGFDFFSVLKKCAFGPWKSWDIRWYASFFIRNGIVLFPHQSMVRNTGHDNSGMHCGDSEYFKSQVITDFIEVKRVELKENKKARKEMKKYFLYLYDDSYFSINNLKSISKKIVPGRIYNFLKKKKNDYLTKRSLS